MTEPFYMVQLELDLPALFRLERRLRLPLCGLDAGYLVHCQLRELFGKEAPKPFFVTPDEFASGRDSKRGRGTATRTSHRKHRRRLLVLGYVDGDEETLIDHARRFASPGAFSALVADSVRTKPMPDGWPVGLELAFEVRICPVIRKARGNARHDKGDELDAFLHRLPESDDESVTFTREDVYRDWLQRRLEAGGTTLLQTQMIRFQLARVLRRNHAAKRVGKWLLRPDATFRGALRVEDPRAFQHLLRRGIGRHRAFGLGMLLLRPRP